MHMKSNLKVKQLARKFGIEAKEIKKVYYSVYRIVTPDGKTYCLKRMRYAPSQLKWIDRTLAKLRQRGFSRIAWRDRNRSGGKPLYIRRSPNGVPFLLMPWIKGVWPSPKSIGDMKESGKILAEFHLAGKEIAITGSGSRNMIGKWPALFRQRHNVLLRKVRIAKTNGHGTALDPLLRKHGAALIKRSRDAIRLMKNSGYRRACRNAREQGSLCHGDGGPTNIILTGGESYLIDFETLRHDLRAYDLFRVVYNSAKDHGFRYPIVKAILDGYQSVSKLNRDDIDLLKVWLAHPHRVSRILGKYDKLPYAKKLKKLRELRLVLSQERTILNLLPKLDDYLGKESSG